MGFGVLTGTMLGTTAALTAPPVSAHDCNSGAPDCPRQTSEEGGVSINDNHAHMWVWDSFCNFNNRRVFGELKVARGSGLPPITPAWEAVCHPPTEGASVRVDVPAGAYAFHKCLLEGGTYACGDWAAL
jgi:hypothetical protein